MLATRLFAVFGFPRLTEDRQLLGVYSTRQRAQALVDVQRRELKITMRIEEIHVDTYPEQSPWRKPGPRRLAIADLEAQVATIVRESGRQKDFDARRWVRQWLSKPLAALGGRRPDELLKTKDGRRVLHELLARIQSGAYS